MVKFKNCKKIFLTIIIYSMLSSNIVLAEKECVLAKDKEGFDVFLDIKTDGICKEIFTTGEYEEHIRYAFKKLIKPNYNVLSLGAHVGHHVLLISKLIGNGGKLYIFEPHPEKLKFLKANLVLNNIKNATIYPYAAFSKSTDLTFSPDSCRITGLSREVSQVHPLDAPLVAHLKNEEETNVSNFITVRTATIDSFPEIQKIDVLQMDIEGAELEAMKGASNLLNNNPDLLIFSEWCTHQMKDPRALVRFWRKKGYKFALIQGDRRLKALNDDELVEPTSSNVIISKNLDQVMKIVNDSL